MFFPTPGSISKKIYTDSNIKVADKSKRKPKNKSLNDSTKVMFSKIAELNISKLILEKENNIKNS
ncbi:MAG: hypothetical protein U9R32_10235, partial [Bacteroidota bacterium]|nr:hypothetical protein [Bacteroidota bacterium]